MKKIINNIYETIQSKAKDIRLVFPEEDSRVLEAKKKLKQLGFQIVELEDVDCSEQNGFFEKSKKLKFAKNWPDLKLKEYLNQPINYGINILKAGLADVLIVGALYPTSETARSSLRFIGLSKKSNCLSSSFLMVSPSEDKLFSYADCAIIPEPSDIQLADIAYNTALNHKLLTNQTPKVAFLSFSTNSSADHYRVSKVKIICHEPA